jgi:hypothetical protein
LKVALARFVPVHGIALVHRIDLAAFRDLNLGMGENELTNRLDCCDVKESNKQMARLLVSYKEDRTESRVYPLTEPPCVDMTNMQDDPYMLMSMILKL